MTRISGEVNLRPTRIGFLVRPADEASISKIMRWSTCLWGGRANPIIPVGCYPACWREKETALCKSDRDVAREYMKFFEPDVLVEAEHGLADSIGYGALAEDRRGKQLIGLDSLYTSKDDTFPEFYFGLSVIDAYEDIYQSRLQFVLRDSSPTLLFNDTELSPFVEAVFGAFPSIEGENEFLQSYVDTFKPLVVDPDVEHWFQIFHKRAVSPFAPTHHKIEVDPRGPYRLSFFILDHTKPVDLIDYWNRCLFEIPVYPIPLCWLSELAPAMIDTITRNRQLGPFNTAVYFGRSIEQETIINLTRDYLADCPEGAFYREGIWHPEVRTGRHGPRHERHTITVDKTSFDIDLIENNTVCFDTIAPSFANRFGAGCHRWANVVTLNSFQTDTFALSYPSNLENRTTPRLFRSLLERPIISREGWVLGQEHKGLREWIELSDGSTAIREWLQHKGIKSELSSAGRIARQVLESLGSLWRVHLLADEETINLLNSMAMQEVVAGKVGDRTRRQYEGRTVQAGRWENLVKKRSENQIQRLVLDDFTKCGILKLGLGVECPNCTHNNWFGLDDVDYEVRCERCLKAFSFPQGTKSPRWKYRVTGPYSVPNFAEGSYCVALTLNLFSHKLSGSPHVRMTYTTGLNLIHEKFEREIDFAFWHSNSRTLGQSTEPYFVFGEAKSFADEAVTDHDIESLKFLAENVPGSIVVISVLKTSFCDAEKARLVDLTKWGWEEVDGRPRAQVLLLTGIELFEDLHVEEAWKDAGAPYPQDADHGLFYDLNEFAQATQRIHLDLDYYAELRKEYATAKKPNG